MACSTPTPSEPTPIERLHSAYLATTDPAIDLRESYDQYKNALVEVMTAGDPYAYNHAFTTITQFADPVADGLADGEGYPERLRELIKVSWELLP